jgi:hypothetical protein
MVVVGWSIHGTANGNMNSHLVEKKILAISTFLTAVIK